MALMNTGFAGTNGEVTERMIDYYEERAKHGVGLIVVEATGVVADVKNMACQPRLADDSYIPGFSNLVERIKAYGAKTFLQIQHSGNEAAFGKLASASDVRSKAVVGVVTPLKVEDIEELIEQFIRTAERAQTAGFDGVEIHAAHGYLLNHFLSPFFNRRTDIYGGSIENRARMIVTIIKGIKSRLGNKFVVSVRYTAKEYIEGGLDVADSILFATLFQAAGSHIMHVISVGYDSTLFEVCLQESDIRIITDASMEEIRKHIVVYRDSKTKETHSVKADMVVIYTGVEPQHEVLEQLSPLPFNVLAEGDCVEPGRIKDAVYQGALAAYQI